jgi:hypothetical protein
MGADTVKVFCPKCQCVYHPPPGRSRSSHHGGAGAAGVDGAAFGTTFPHLFLMTFNNLVPDPLPHDSAYIARVFGFRVHVSARQRISTGSVASALLSSSNNRPRDAADNNNKRLSFVGRRSTKDSIDRNQLDSEPAESPQEGAALLNVQDSTMASSQNAKEGVDSAKPARGSNEENSTREDDGSRKSKTGKRRHDADSGSKKSETSNGNGLLDAPAKRRRKSDNDKG